MLSLQKGEGGGDTVLAILTGGHKSFKVVLTQGLEGLAILNGGTKSSPLSKWGCEKFYTVLKGGGGGGRKKIQTFFPFCSPPPPPSPSNQ